MTLRVPFLSRASIIAILTSILVFGGDELGAGGP